MISTDNRIIQAFNNRSMSASEARSLARNWVALLDDYDNVNAWRDLLPQDEADLLEQAITGDLSVGYPSRVFADAYERGSKRVAEARRYLTSVTYLV